MVSFVGKLSLVQSTMFWWHSDPPVQALVKVRVCEDCAPKLYWKKTKELKKLAKIVVAHTSDAASPAAVAADGAMQLMRTGHSTCARIHTYIHRFALWLCPFGPSPLRMHCTTGRV